MKNKKRIYFIGSLVIIFLGAFLGAYYYLTNFVYLQATDTLKEWQVTKKERMNELVNHTQDEKRAFKLLVEERINYLVNEELPQATTDAVLIDLKEKKLDIDLVLTGQPTKDHAVKEIVRQTEHIVQRSFDSFSEFERININWKNEKYEEEILQKWKDLLKEKQIAYDPKYFADTNYIARFDYDVVTKELIGRIDEYLMTNKNRNKYDYVPIKEEEKIKSLQEYYEEWLNSSTE